MAKGGGTKQILTPKGREILLQMLAMKSKPFVKVGVLQENYLEEKKVLPGEKQQPVTLGEVAVANEFGTGTVNGYSDQIFGDKREGVGAGVHIPERSFIRSTVDAHAKGDWKREGEALKKEIIAGRMSTDGALKRMGMRIKAAIQEKIRSMVPPPNAESTILRKGGKDKTLIATGQLLNSMDYEVHREAE